MHSKELFEKKLFIARDVRGNPNTEVIKQVRELERRLESHPAFIGIGLYGSSAKDYSIDSSDIDIKILFDAQPGEESIKAHDDIEKIANSVRDEFMIDRRKPIAFQFRNINLGAVMPDLISENPEVRVMGIAALADILMVVTGKKIGHYRHYLVKRLREIPQEMRDSIKKELIERIIKIEELGQHKREQRLPDTVGKRDEIIQARKRLWNNRVEKFINEKGD